MNPNSEVIAKATANLKELYKLGENLMTCPDNADKVNDLLVDVSNAYDLFTSLCSHLSCSDVIPGSSATKLEFDADYGEFKKRVQEWFDSLVS